MLTFESDAGGTECSSNACKSASPCRNSNLRLQVDRPGNPVRCEIHHQHEAKLFHLFYIVSNVLWISVRQASAKVVGTDDVN